MQTYCHYDRKTFKVQSTVKNRFFITLAPGLRRRALADDFSGADDAKTGKRESRHFQADANDRVSGAGRIRFRK
jgi:hypothetical protein